MGITYEFSTRVPKVASMDGAAILGVRIAMGLNNILRPHYERCGQTPYTVLFISDGKFAELTMGEHYADSSILSDMILGKQVEDGRYQLHFDGGALAQSFNQIASWVGGGNAPIAKWDSAIGMLSVRYTV